MGQKTVKNTPDTPYPKPVAHAPGSERGTVVQSTIWTLAGLLLSAVLLTVIYEPFGLAWIAWIAWVPFMLVCGDKISMRRLLIAAYLVGFCWWFYNLHWLYIVTSPGWLSFSLVQGLYWPVLAYCVRFVRRKGRPLFIWAPLLFVGAEALQGYLFTGFSWYFLAHSQYEFLPLIQISDIFGALGVSVLIAMVNGVVTDWLLFNHKKHGLTDVRPCHPRQCNGTFARLAPWRFYYTILCVLLLGGACFYGHWRLSQTPAYVTEGPLVGSVQPNVPANVKEEIENGPKILDDLINDSNQCIEAGAELVVWPETMVLAAMNPQYRLHCKEMSDPVQFHKQIIAHCQDRCYVLFGAHAVGVGIRDGRYDITDQHNSAYLYRPDSRADLKRYDKIHLVPFGEYIPFQKSAPWIYKMILFLSPYDYDYNLTPGTDYTTFEMETGGQTYRFGVLICYEDTDSTVTRKHILDENGNKKCDWLVNISNDGWYVRFKNQQVLPMAELSQRTAISVFRCIENRISLVRSVNTGISCLIEPTGAIRDQYKAGNLPENAMARQGMDGWFVDTVPIDSRVTFFTRHGRWLNCVLAMFFVLNFGLTVYGSRKKKLKTGG